MVNSNLLQTVHIDGDYGNVSCRVVVFYLCGNDIFLIYCFLIFFPTEHYTELFTAFNHMIVGENQQFCICLTDDYTGTAAVGFLCEVTPHAADLCLPLVGNSHHTGHALINDL